jgi:plastocyanin
MLRMATFIAALGVILCMVGIAAGEERAPKTHTVTIEGMRFQPDVLTVAPGDTLVWVN